MHSGMNKLYYTHQQQKFAMHNTWQVKTNAACLHSVTLSLAEDDVSSRVDSFWVQLSLQISKERLRLPICNI